MPARSSDELMVMALEQLCHARAPAKVLDFGCGAGRLVKYLGAQGYDAWGCDNGFYRGGDYAPDSRLLEINSNPYRLPFEDNTFDAVISTSVLEHAQNKEEIFREIHRVLKPAAITLHLFPGKYYLPAEPHIFIPFVSWMWPNVPKWWLALWSILGVRNEFRKDFTWRQNLARDIEFCDFHLSYWKHDKYTKLVSGIFGNVSYPNRWYVENASGGGAKLARLLPFKSATAWLLSRTREGFILARKKGDVLP